MIAETHTQTTTAAPAVETVVEVRNLVVGTTTARLVDGVSFTVPSGRTVALVGESGAGKSVSARALMGLLPAGVEVLGGEILVNGRDVSRFNPRQWRSVRGRELSMVFQNPLRSLNPTMRVGAQIAEAVRLYDPKLGRAGERARVLELLEQVRIPDPERRLFEYPHQLSGGMRQRVVIAIALASNPRVLIADEPTTALDVTTQAQILDLLDTLQAENGMSIVLVTHDIRVAEERAHEVIVMYSGRIAETGRIGDVVRSPMMPYTRALIAAVPSFDVTPRSLLPTIPGRPPHPSQRSAGCAFAPRCPLAEARCDLAIPDVTSRPGNNGTPQQWRCFVTGKTDQPGPTGQAGASEEGEKA